MDNFPPDDAKRIVKPRQRKSNYLQVIVLSGSQILLERTGETFSCEALPTILYNEPPSILVSQGFGEHLQRLKQVYENDPRFNYRLSPKYRGEKTPFCYDAVCNFVGWKYDKDTRHGGYHYPLDPVQFVRTGIDELKPTDESRIIRLYEWGQEVRDWCAEQRIQVKPSSGGLVSQLMRDPRFYPSARRKVPRLINEIARKQLPGNHYHLLADTHRKYQAVYLDMTNAHHSVASTIQFPDANTLHAYGRWSTGKRLYASGGNHRLLTSWYGLFHLYLRVPFLRSDHFPTPILANPGEREAWVFSNELPMLHELGVEIQGIIAALVSPDADPGLNTYSKFAIAEIARNPSYRPWLKPTLHSTYGVLAARPAPFETGYLRSRGGISKDYPMGNVSLPVRALRTNGAIESSLANVIHRGMIEAEVRAQSLWFARYLTEVEHRQVLGVYADSVFIRNDGRPINLLPPPWRVAAYLDDLTFYDPTHFVSTALTRLPGIAETGDQKTRLERLAKRETRTVRARVQFAKTPAIR